MHTLLFSPFGVWIEPMHSNYPGVDADIEYWNSMFFTFAWIWAIVIGAYVIIFPIVVPKWKKWKEKDF